MAVKLYSRIIFFVCIAFLVSACGGGSSKHRHKDMEPKPVAQPVIAPGSQEDLATNVGDRIYFPLNQNQLDSNAQETLKRQAAWLEKYPQISIQIAGNCDDRGTEEYNIALGQRRASIAKNFLRAQGIAPQRISIISYGKDRPVAEGDNEQAWQQNRNAITTIR